MTEAQRIHLMAELWPRACKAQGWKAADRALRLRVLGEAVGRQLGSASELGSTGDFDAVKAHLGMLCDNVAATIETDNPAIGRARRLRAVIRGQLRDLRAFHDNPEALLAKLIRQKFGSALSLDDLTADPIIKPNLPPASVSHLAGPSQLDQIVRTLARILQRKQAAARIAQREAERAGQFPKHREFDPASTPEFWQGMN